LTDIRIDLKGKKWPYSIFLKFLNLNL
jgi:hypothetical protein